MNKSLGADLYNSSNMASTSMKQENNNTNAVKMPLANRCPAIEIAITSGGIRSGLMPVRTSQRDAVGGHMLPSTLRIIEYVGCQTYEAQRPLPIYWTTHDKIPNKLLRSSQCTVIEPHYKPQAPASVTLT